MRSVSSVRTVPDRISKRRRCVRDYETLPEHHEAMVHIAMIMTMARRLTRTT